MADWRQIQARIRKARNSADPVAKLSELYQRTHDGMVAWELGAVEEKDGRSDEAVKWYKTAAEKFRRSDWKKKAEEALTRLGVQAPAQSEETEREGLPPEMATGESQAQEELRAHNPAPLAMSPAHEAVNDDVEESDEEEAATERETAEEANAAVTAQAQPGDGARRKRRRGRRGGRGRRKRGAANAAGGGLPAQAYAPGSSGPAHAQPSAQSIPQTISAASSERVTYEAPARRHQQAEARSEPIFLVPQLPSERAAHGRTDPGLSSRMAQLESLLRRLLNSPLHRLGEADEAPAGPGVFLLSDSDQTSSYYIEACQTLRVGVGNLGRSGRSRNLRGTETNFKEKLAEHLGINEAKVSQYMKDHCVVRWIQLDDEAANLAHFAIGVLKTPLNAD